MEYVTDEQGQIKVMDAQGNTKWFCKSMIDQTRLMQRNGFTVVTKPFSTEPIANSQEPMSSQENNQDNVGESSMPKKRGRPSNQ